MPYGDTKSLPKYLQKYSPKVKRQWMHVFNTTHKKTGSEARAFRAANSVLKKRFEGKNASNLSHHDKLSMLVDKFIGNLKG